MDDKINDIIDVVSGKKDIKIGIDKQSVLLLSISLFIVITLAIWLGRKLP